MPTSAAPSLSPRLRRATRRRPIVAALIRSAGDEAAFVDALVEYRDAANTMMTDVLAVRRFGPELSRRLADYPLRAGKGLRPALCLATCGAFGGRTDDALPSAVALELFHNAFLVHDDVEDESVHRRGA